MPEKYEGWFKNNSLQDKPQRRERIHGEPAPTKEDPTILHYDAAEARAQKESNRLQQKAAIDAHREVMNKQFDKDIDIFHKDLSHGSKRHVDNSRHQTPLKGSETIRGTFESFERDHAENSETLGQ